MYKGIIGSLLYLIARRLDIFFGVDYVRIFTRFKACPTESNLKADKESPRYSKKTKDMFLFCLEGDSFDFVRFVDVDFAGYQVDRKRTDEMALSWTLTHLLRIQETNLVSLSTIEVDYVQYTKPQVLQLENSQEIL